MGAHARSKDAERAEDARRSNALVSALVNELLVNARLSSVPLVLAAGCKLVGSFASLVGAGAAAGGNRPRFGSGGIAGGGGGEAGAGGEVGGGGEGFGGVNAASLLPRALLYLSAGLQHEASRDRAAIAVRTLAASCERVIVTSPTALEALLQVGGWVSGLV